MSHRSAHLARILPPSIILSRGPKGVQGIACNTKNAEIGICEVRMQYPGEELPDEDRKASIEYVSQYYTLYYYILNGPRNACRATHLLKYQFLRVVGKVAHLLKYLLYK